MNKTRQNYEKPELVEHENLNNITKGGTTNSTPG